MANAYRQNISESTATVTHNRDSEDILVVVYKATGTDDPVLIIPSSVTLTDTNTAVVAFSNIVEGYVIVTDGKGVATGGGGSAVTASYALTASYIEMANAYRQNVSGSSATVTHNRDSEDVLVAVYETTGGTNPELIIPASIILTNTNTAEVTFDPGIIGYVIVTDGKGIANNSVTSSYAITASYALNAGSGGGSSSGSYVSSSTSGDNITFTKGDGSQITNKIISSSYSLTASYALNGGSGGSSNAYVSSSTTGNQINFNRSSGGVVITPIISASHATTAISSSYAITASYLLGFIQSASYALTSSYAVSSSHAEFADSSSYAVLSSTASLATTAITSSYALTASFVIGSIESASYALRAETVRTVTYPARNDDSVIIQKGDPVFVTEVNNGIYDIRKAEALDPNKMPAVGVAATTAALGASVEMLLIGEIKNTNTFGANPGRNIYVAANGGYSQTKPLAPALIQPIGIIAEASATEGVLLINGPMADMSSGSASVPTASYVSSSNVDGPFGFDSILTSSYALTASYVLSDSTNNSYRESVSGTTTYTIVHNLNENFPIVQAYELASLSQEIPQSVTSTNASTISVSFINNFDGTIVVIK